MTDTRSSSALFKRAEQLKRWEKSDTNKQSPIPKQASRIQFSSGIVFLAACTAGDKDEVQRLLNLGADINTANVDGLTALHQACIDNNLDMVEFLVSRGADVNRGDNEGWTALHATASCGFISIARYLLENGADVAAVNYDGELPVDIADSDSMQDMLQKAIDEKGIDCEASRNAEVNTLTNDAAKWAKNGYVEVRDPKTGGTPLHVAAAKGYIDVAKILLEECSADPDIVDYEGWTPLHAAALWGQAEAAALLLKYGADPDIKNYSGQTCLDLVDQGIATWLKEEILKTAKSMNNNNNNNERKRNTITNDIVIETKIKRQEIPPKPPVKTEPVVNDKPPVPVPEVVSKPNDAKPPKGRAPSPEATTSENANSDDTPLWRRSASFRSRHAETAKETEGDNNNDSDLLRRTHSFGNDETVSPSERRDRESATWNAKNSTNATQSNNTQTTVRSSMESLELSTNSNSSTPSTTTPTKLSPGNIFKNFFKSFVPPVRDEESETQRKAHAKRVRETRRSTQGVTLDEIKSAEQLVKKKPSNGTTVSGSTESINKSDDATSPTTNVDHTAAFELEDAGRTSPRTAASPDASVTLPLRRPPTGSTANTTSAPTPTDERVDDEKERESSTESKSSSSASPASTQAALNVIKRRRRPKRRSTGVGHVDMDDIVNDHGGGGEGDCDDNVQSGGEQSAECDRDYKALYEASQAEVRRLRSLLTTSEQQLRDARATITRLTQVNQNSLSDIDKREKRAMERKLSEMEEELKYQQALQAENQRLKDENGALIRVISKLSK